MPNPNPDRSNAQSTLSTSELFIGFTKISLSGFGGVLPWARRTIVEQKQWITAAEFNAILGICQLVPGPNIVNLAVCMWVPALAAQKAHSQRSWAYCWHRLVWSCYWLCYTTTSVTLPSVQGMLRGISAVGVGLIAATGFKMLREELRYPRMLVVVVVTLFIATWLRLPLGWVVLIASPLALFIAWHKAKGVT
jgi:chromate transporter